MFRRNLNVYEKYLALPTVDQRFNFCLVAEYTGKPISIGRFQNALEQVRLSHPNLNVKVGFENGEKVFLECKNSISISEIILDIGESWEPVAVDQIHLPFDHKVGPLCRLIHLKSVHSNIILLVFDHLIADGVSAMNLLIEIMSIAFDNQSNALKPKYAFPNFANLISSERSSNDLGVRLLAYSGKKGNATSSGIIQRKVHIKIFSDLKTRCKEHSVSFHSLVHAIALESLYEKIATDNQIIENPVEIGFNVPVDLRKYLDLGSEQLACFVGDIFGTVKFGKSGGCIFDIARQISQYLKAKLQDDLASETWYMIQKLMQGVSTYDQLKLKKRWLGPMISLSNLGKMKIYKPTEGIIRSISACGAIHGTLFCENQFCIIFGAFNDHGFFSLTYPKPLMSSDQAEKFMDRFLDKLQLVAKVVQTV